MSGSILSLVEPVVPDSISEALLATRCFLYVFLSYWITGVSLTSGYYSDFSVGWRFSPRLLVEYVLSTDYGLTVPSHTLLLRYTFHPPEK